MRKFEDLGLITNLDDFVENLKYDDLQFVWEQQSLYHYTSSHSLESILTKKELWLSKYDFLNDRTEVKYTIGLVNKIVNDMLSDNPTIEELVFQETINQYLNRNELLFDAYILSLSKNPDSNLLWSNYGTDDGYNIEFDYPFLATSLQKEFNGIHGEDRGSVQPYYVIYDPRKQREYLEVEVQNLYRIFKYCYNLNDDSLFRRSIGKPIGNIYLYSLFFKDECFSQEDEFRIAFIIQKAKTREPIYQCRVSKGVFIPYLPMKISESHDEQVINSITIGPKNNLDIAEDGLKHFLNKCSLSQCSIRKSAIPYRY